MRWWLPALLPLLGCEPPEQAPKELDDLVGFLFDHLRDEDTSLLAAGVTNLDAWLIEDIETTTDGYAVNNLDQQTIDSLEGVVAEIDGNLQGAAVGHESPHDAETIISTLLTTSSAEIYPKTYLSSDREIFGDADCFLAGECDFLDAHVANSLDYTLLTAEVASALEYRRVPFGQGDVILERDWLDETPALSVDWLRLDAQLFLRAFIPTEEGGSRQVAATWFVYTFLDADLDEAIALNIVIDSMSKQSTELDTWISDEQSGLHDDPENTE